MVSVFNNLNVFTTYLILIACGTLHYILAESFVNSISKFTNHIL